jgi:DNA mismatch endonuclease (patch repair protein)
LPKSRTTFWQEKLSGNVARDSRSLAALAPKWQVLVLWECEVGDIDSLRGRIVEFMEARDEGT